MNARSKFAVVALVAAVMCWLVEHNIDWIAGPWYWRWGWRRIDPIRLIPPMLLAASPLFLAQWLYERGRARDRRARLPLALVTISLFLMMLVSVGVQKWPFHLKRIAEVITSPYATSYYTDAADWMNDSSGPSLHSLLSSYPERMGSMHLHSRLRPPGPLLFHAFWIRLLGAGNRAALTAGMIILALAALAVPATYAFVRQFAPDRPDAAFHAASLLALSPGLVWFSPTFDQIYPLFMALLLCLWAAALRRDSVALSLAFSLALSAALFVTFSVLVLGVFLVGITVMTARASMLGLRRVARLVLLAATGVVVAYFGLWLVTGYSAPATLAAALTEQAKLTAEFFPPRPYPFTVPFDLLDFALGAGWIVLPLLMFYAINRQAKPRDAWSRWGVRLALFQILAVAISGTLAAETARVWIFLQPLVMLPIGRELDTWDLRPRLGAYAAQFAVMTAVGGNMWLLVE